MRALPRQRPVGMRSTQDGALLIEAMVSLVICAFGLLGFVGVQARAIAAEFESYQRSKALSLVDDMVSRINANRNEATNYASTALVGAGPVQDCNGLVGAALDLCQWGNLLRGSAEIRGASPTAGSRVGAMMSARGCITRPALSSDRYNVVVVWQGIVGTGGAPNPCGQGDVTFADESLRRAVSMTVCIGRLRDPVVAPVLPRC